MAPSRIAVVLSLLIPAAVLADSNPQFAQLRDAAEPISSLEGFLDRYIGECTDFLGADECRKNAAQFRKNAAGKRFYMIINEESASMISNGPYNPGKGIYTINILPFFAAGRYALTHGLPKKQDERGNPVLPLIQVQGKTPIGWNAVRIQKLFDTRALRVQVVFKPVGVWSMPRKRGGKLYGVRAQVEAILVTIGRSGDQVALWVSPDRGS